MGALYRVRQFVAALRPLSGPAEAVPVAARLTAQERALFARLAPPDRRHSLAVVRRLEAAGCGDPDLLRAALLHDIGKAEAKIRLHHRVLIVLLQRLAPGVLASLTRQEAAAGWRRPFWVHAHHAEVGARLAKAAGASEAVVDLIARHHERPSAGDDEALAALRGADGAE